MTDPIPSTEALVRALLDQTPVLGEMRVAAIALVARTRELESEVEQLRRERDPEARDFDAASDLAENAALRAEVERRRADMAKVQKAAIERGYGVLRCRLCEVTADGLEEVPHRPTCPLRAALHLAADDFDETAAMTIARYAENLDALRARLAETEAALVGLREAASKAKRESEIGTGYYRHDFAVALRALGLALTSSAPLGARVIEEAERRGRDETPGARRLLDAEAARKVALAAWNAVRETDWHPQYPGDPIKGHDPKHRPTHEAFKAADLRFQAALVDFLGRDTTSIGINPDAPRHLAALAAIEAAREEGRAEERPVFDKLLADHQALTVAHGTALAERDEALARLAAVSEAAKGCDGLGERAAVAALHRICALLTNPPSLASIEAKALEAAAEAWAEEAASRTPDYAAGLRHGNAVAGMDAATSWLRTRADRIRGGA